MPTPVCTQTGVAQSHGSRVLHALFEAGLPGRHFECTPGAGKTGSTPMECVEGTDAACSMGLQGCGAVRDDAIFAAKRTLVQAAQHAKLAIGQVHDFRAHCAFSGSWIWEGHKPKDALYSQSA